MKYLVFFKHAMHENVELTKLGFKLFASKEALDSFMSTNEKSIYEYINRRLFSLRSSRERMYDSIMSIITPQDWEQYHNPETKEQFTHKNWTKVAVMSKSKVDYVLQGISSMGGVGASISIDPLDTFISVKDFADFCARIETVEISDGEWDTISRTIGDSFGIFADFTNIEYKSLNDD